MDIVLGFAIDNAPLLSSTMVLCNVFEHSEMRIVRTFRELAERNGGIANVGTTGDIGVEQFPQESVIRKTMFCGERITFRCAFSRT